MLPVGLKGARGAVMIAIKSIWSLIKESVSQWSEDYAPSMGAALAYYTIFSIAPLLVIAIAVAGFFFGQDAASGEIFAQLRGLLGDEGAAAIQGLVKSASEPGKGAFAAIAGVVTLLLGATTVFGELQSDLDRIWDAPKPEKSGIWGMLRGRLLSFGMILGIGFLLLVSLIFSAALSALSHFWDAWFTEWEFVLQTINFVVSFAMITGLFAMIYKLLPRCDIGWKDVWVGAIVTSALFSVGKLLIGLYLGKSSVASGFGAAVAMPLLGLVMPLKILVPAWTLIAGAAGVALLGEDRKHVAWREMLKLVPITLPLNLNRTGKFTVELKVNDEIGKKSVSESFDLNVVEPK